MKKVIVFLFIFLCASRLYAAVYSNNPSDLNPVIDTAWKFIIGLDQSDFILIYFGNEFADSSTTPALLTIGINNSATWQYGITYATIENHGFACILTHPLGYQNWYEVYVFEVDENSASGSFFNFYDTWAGSEKWLNGQRLEDFPQDPNYLIYVDSNIPSAQDIPIAINSKKDDEKSKFGCFIHHILFTF